MTRQFLKFATGWMLVVGVLASGSSGVVLCIGDDGHLAVEPEHHGHCDQKHDAAGQEHDGTPVSDASSAACEACGCVDVALGSDALSHDTKPLTQNRLQKGSASPLFAVGYARLAQPDVHGAPRQVHGATQILAQSLLEKRTIVLLV